MEGTEDVTLFLAWMETEEAAVVAVVAVQQKPMQKESELYSEEERTLQTHTAEFQFQWNTPNSPPKAAERETTTVLLMAPCASSRCGVASMRRRRGREIGGHGS